MRATKASTPEDYVATLDGWQRECVSGLRKAVRSVRKLEEVVKWGHLVYQCNGPVLLIRSEETRVLFGFWRGQRLRAIEPRLEASGRYEMATLELHEGDSMKPSIARRLAEKARALNEELGDPRDAVKPASTRRPAPRAGTTKRGMKQSASGATRRSRR